MSFQARLLSSVAVVPIVLARLSTLPLADVKAWLKDDKEMQHDRARLIKVCCSVCLPPALEGAPMPASVVMER